MAKIIGKDLPNIPWQEPDGTEKLPVWRYKENPIIERFAAKNSNSIFNSAVVPYGDGFAGVFRCDSRSISMDIFPGFSKDGIRWEISDEPIALQGACPEVAKREFRYDPRVCFIEDRYYVTWCNGYSGIPPSDWHILMIFRLFINWKMHSCRLIATGCCSPVR